MLTLHIFNVGKRDAIRGRTSKIQKDRDILENTDSLLVILNSSLCYWAAVTLYEQSFFALGAKIREGGLPHLPSDASNSVKLEFSLLKRLNNSRH